MGVWVMNVIGRNRLLLLLAGVPSVSFASEVEGATLGLYWVIPFVGILLSIALFPVLAAEVWHRHFGKITAAWAGAFLLLFSASYGLDQTASLVAHALLTEYLPFIILLFALYTLSGGILIQGNRRASARFNTGLLALGTFLASIMGTTGAAMLLIRPLLRANEQRHHRVHVVVFFIFLVANIGGGLTPLGDPPLFLGFLKGVDFFWTVQHMALPVASASAVLLLIFYFLDRHFFAREACGKSLESSTPVSGAWRVEGRLNFGLLFCVVACVLLSGVWNPQVEVVLWGTPIALQNLVRDGLLLGLAALSWYATPYRVRQANEFDWGPMVEVAKLFAGIFITIVPVIAILRAGDAGGLGAVVHWVSTPEGAPIQAMYFWMSGLLSSVLDNAPTYLVFFNLASGDAQTLMNQLPQTLVAISMGSVFMGAVTYVGNAPNFMVKAIAEQHGVPMPSFFGYLLWSSACLMPLFALQTVIQLT